MDTITDSGLMTEFSLDRILNAAEKYKYETHMHTKKQAHVQGAPEQRWCARITGRATRAS